MQEVFNTAMYILAYAFIIIFAALILGVAIIFAVWDQNDTVTIRSDADEW